MYVQKKSTALPCADFQENYKSLTKLCASVLYQIHPESVSKCGIYGQILIFSDT
jgi:hypothetical protein